MSWQDMTRSVRRIARGAFHVGVPGTQSVVYVKNGVEYSTTPAGEELQGIFREHHDDIDLVSGSRVETYRPELDVEVSDLPGIAEQRDLVRVLGKQYLVEITEIDGEGGLKLILQELNP